MKGHIHEKEHAETAVAQNPTGIYVSPEEIQGRFDLLRDLSSEQMNELNIRVRKKIDWRMMPIVSLMYLMK